MSSQEVRVAHRIPVSELAPLLASPALAQSLVPLATHASSALPALSHEAPAGLALRIRAPVAAPGAKRYFCA